MNSDLLHRVDQWLAIDPDPATVAELRHLLETDPDRVAQLFSGRITFGTAGLRAPMGPGPTLMNRLVVRQTTAGLMEWLDDGPTVVIGFDARHNSEAFANDTAEIVAQFGGRAEMLPGPLPTPVLARAVLDRGADAGVMITASHNPAADNGYKLYLADGIQLVDPADGEIAAAIPTGAIPPPNPSRPGEIVHLDNKPAEQHLAVAMKANPGTQRDIKVAYSSMHGVGGAHLMAAFAQAGFLPPVVVREQFHPDPDFPTVAFPNPEEPGALDLLIAVAEDHGADVALANDPDADRLAVAVPARASAIEAGGPAWARLSGDQVGVLLADYLLALPSRAGNRKRLVASSIVSSRLINDVAAQAGAISVRTLTGFKWVARPIVDQSDHEYVLGYEEALGYCVGGEVRDKDGISAALVMATLVAELIERGETVWSRLDAITAQHGVFLTRPVSILLDGVDGMARRAEMMTAALEKPPTSLAGVAVARIDDLSLGIDLPPTPGVVWHLADESQVIVRPSGTEPKLKAYLEVIERLADGESIEQATERATAKLGALAEAVTAVLNR